MTKLMCLMPLYNKAETLPRAIESVLMQITDFEFKLLIIDDCSSDNSYSIACSYQDKYPNIISVIRNSTNQRLLKTIIKAYSCLKEIDYFCVLDPDDYYTYKHKFHNAVLFLDNNKSYSVYMSNVIVEYQDHREKMYTGLESSVDFDFYDYFNGEGIFIQTSGCIFRNIYFFDHVDNDFLSATESEFKECFRADGFRLPWHLKKGKTHFVNHIESCYVYNENGIWSSLKKIDQMLFNTEMFCALSVFFLEDKNFFIVKAKDILKKVIFFDSINLINNYPSRLIKYEKVIRYLYPSFNHPEDAYGLCRLVIPDAIDFVDKTLNFILSNNINNIYLYCANDLSLFFYDILFKKNISVSGIFDSSKKSIRNDIDKSINKLVCEDDIKDNSIIIICSNKYYSEIVEEVKSIVSSKKRIYTHSFSDGATYSLPKILS